MDINIIASLITDEPDILNRLLLEAIKAGDNRAASIILEDFKRWLVAAAAVKAKGNLEQSEDEIVNIAKSLDPTAEEKEPYKYVDWILKIMKPVGGHPQIILTDKEDLDGLKNALTKYEQYKPISQRANKSMQQKERVMTSVKLGDEDVQIVNINDVASLKPNIGDYRTIQDLRAALHKVDEGLGIVSSAPQQLSSSATELLPGAKIVNETDNYVLVEITNAKTLFDYGQGTAWCTAGSVATAQSYLDQCNGAQFQIWQKPDMRPIIQFQPDFGQFKDVKDHETQPDLEMKKLITPNKEDVKRSPHRIVGWAQKLKRDSGGKSFRWEEMEPEIIKIPRCAAEYAVAIIGDRWKEAEPMILTNAYAAALYANSILYQSMDAPEIEAMMEPILPKIKQNPKAARTLVKPFKYDYRTRPRPENAKPPLGRWEEAEPYILKDPNQAIEYFKEHRDQFPNNNWDELIQKIMSSNDPRAVVALATDVIKGRMPALESIILGDPNQAISYFSSFRSEFASGHWELLEKVILNSPDRADWMHKYASLTGNRWPEIEDLIINNLTVATQYYEHFRSKFKDRRWPQLEEALLAGNNPEAITAYALQLDGRWPAAEPLIVRNAETAYKYAAKVGKFPLGDQLFMGRSIDDALKYVKESMKPSRRSKAELWPEFEAKIANNAKYSYEYSMIINKRFQAGEDAIAKDPAIASLYIQKFNADFADTRWPAFEEMALAKINTHPNLITIYISHTHYSPEGVLEHLKEKAPMYYRILTALKTRARQGQP
jgi:hypothetical protein